MSYSYNIRKKALRKMRRIAKMKSVDVEKLVESKHIRDIKTVEFLNANLDKINEQYKLMPLKKLVE